jgi:glutathione S-transferase
MSSENTLIVGSYLSPYVRKVLVCLDLKAVDYRVDPLVPFYGNDDFNRISPLRRVPVLMDDRVTLADSTVICEYLDERYPESCLYPEGPGPRARARWLEEFADTRMGETFIWHLYNELVIRRYVWGETPDPEVLARALTEEIPGIMDYLESELPPGGFLFGQIGVADIAIASFFRNAAFARHTVDADRWPVTADFVARVLDHESFAKLRVFEELSLRTPIHEHRRALTEAGAPISTDTFAGTTPRRGLLSI